jgi:hypothetical protein
MKHLMVVGLVVTLVSGVSAQQPSDTGEAGRLRAQIEQRFTDRVQQELKLSPDQTTKLRASQERYGTRRRTLMTQQMQRRRALEEQMEPGVAANSDSVRKLMDGIRAGRSEMVKIEQDEDQEMSGYLTPVQHARYQQMREGLMRRVGEMRRERLEGRGMGRRPGVRAGGRRRGI